MTARPALRAPAGDGEILAWPPMHQVGALAEANRGLLDSSTVSLLGTPLAEVRRAARAEILQAAQAYLGWPQKHEAPGPLIVAGHQPELFHPGVWIKNFALSHLAQQLGGVGLNLIIDNDTLKRPSIDVPVPGDPIPHLEAVPFDAWRGEEVYEERPVLDREVFASFARRVRELMNRWPIEPILPALWPVAVKNLNEPLALGERLVRARRWQEHEWGCRNLELPMSLVCASRVFALFAQDLLDRLPTLHAAYNEAVRAYRAKHRIRSRHHPVPDLTTEGDWLEIPLWCWKRGERRGRLFAQRRGERVQWRCHQEIVPAQDWEAQGWKIRPRALTTTLFARLILGDAFIHGIGGAVYDELTDDLMRRAYGIEPPDFLVLSATLRLPLPQRHATLDDEQRLRWLLRDLEWNPQRHGATGELAEVKRRLMEQQPPDHRARRQRFRELQEVTRQMRSQVEPLRNEVLAELERVERDLKARELCARRDFSLGVFPAEALRALFQSL